MKNLKKILLLAFLFSIGILPNQLHANNGTLTNSLPPVENPVEAARAQVLLNRLDQIKSMDKSNINANEKKALRQETKSIKKELKQISGGVYLSTGAIILIIIILILIL